MDCFSPWTDCKLEVETHEDVANRWWLLVSLVLSIFSPSKIPPLPITGLCWWEPWTWLPSNHSSLLPSSSSPPPLDRGTSPSPSINHPPSLLLLLLLWPRRRPSLSRRRLGVRRTRGAHLGRCRGRGTKTTFISIWELLWGPCGRICRSCSPRTSTTASIGIIFNMFFNRITLFRFFLLRFPILLAMFCFIVCAIVTFTFLCVK